MAAFIGRRCAAAAAALLGALVVIFLVVRLVPGDPVLVLLGDTYTPEMYQATRHALGVDKPLPVQLLKYLEAVLRGDFGNSFRNSKPVLPQLLEQFPFTFSLAAIGLIIAVVVGVPAGVASALRRNSWMDQSAMVVALLGICTPSFWLGILLMLMFSLHLDWLPAVGGGDLREPLTVLRHALLPATTLGLASAALIARLTRSALLEILGQDYVRTARSKGLRECAVIARHALRNALVPIITVVGIDLGRMLAGTTVVEILFSRPGIGHLLINALKTRDYPLIQGAIVFYVAVIILVNTFVDVLYSVVDPRIRNA